MPTPDIKYAISLEPKEALAYFKSLGFDDTAFDFKQAAKAAESNAFAVAGVLRTDILQDINVELKRVMTEGRTTYDFMRDTAPMLEKKGYWLPKGDKGRHIVDKATGEIVGKKISKHHLQTILVTNMARVYMAGRYIALRANVENRPFWQYVAVMDRRTRPAHAALNGRVFRYDDEFWNSFWPPNGYRCRCTVRALDQADMDSRKIDLSSSQGQMDEVDIPWSTRNPNLGKDRVARFEYAKGKFITPDAGFSHNVGKQAANLASLGQLQLNRSLLVTDPKLAAVSTRYVLAQPDMLKAFTGKFAAWADGVKHPGGQLQHVGVLPAIVVSKLELSNIAPQSALLSVRDEDVLHTHRPAKGKADGDTKKLPWGWYRELPRHLMNYRAVLLDKTESKPVLLMVFDVPGEETAKLVVKLDYELTVRNEVGVKQNIKTNVIRSGRMEDVNGLRGFEVLDGAL
jgi:SPP1 gp7 family putative phage head morphogenesis protein